MKPESESSEQRGTTPRASAAARWRRRGRGFGGRRAYQRLRKRYPLPGDQAPGQRRLQDGRRSHRSRLDAAGGCCRPRAARYGRATSPGLPSGAAQQLVRGLIWWFYSDLKAYRAAPTVRRRSEMRARFDLIFLRNTGIATLDRLLQRLHANKAELLMVLDHPEIPLHTSGSENDIRYQVTKRQVHGGTKTDTGRDCRDAFLGLGKTCKKRSCASRSGTISAPGSAFPPPSHAFPG